MGCILIILGILGIKLFGLSSTALIIIGLIVLAFEESNRNKSSERDDSDDGSDEDY